MISINLSFRVLVYIVAFVMSKEQMGIHFNSSIKQEDFPLRYRSLQVVFGENIYQKFPKFKCGGLSPAHCGSDGPMSLVNFYTALYGWSLRV
jgi:hypothetical protein